MLEGLIAGVAILLLAIVFLIIVLAYTKVDVKELQDKERKRAIDELRGSDSKKSDSVSVPAQFVTHATMARIIDEYYKDSAEANERINELKKLADLQQREIELMFGLISGKRHMCQWTESQFASLVQEINDINEGEN